MEMTDTAGTDLQCIRSVLRIAGPHKIHGSTQQISHQTSSGTPSLLLYRIVKLKQLIYEIRDKQIAKEIFQVNQTYIIAGSGES